MPKIIELTVELDIQRVSCPGVWLCQDGRVSLTVFALGTSYQTCLLPPNFPLMFKDIFYFRKRYQETCALSNMCCLLKDETIYCELVQWSDNCSPHSGCTILAQYLGALNDVLFPPNMCSNDGVDLLMRRSKDFPGILSPKVEIATKVRIDEVWNQAPGFSQKVDECHCSPCEPEGSRQKQVCHSAKYHRKKCYSNKPPSRSGSKTRSDAGESRSCCSLTPKETTVKCPYVHPKPKPRPVDSRCETRRDCPQYYNVYNVTTESCPFTYSLASECDEEPIRSCKSPAKTKASLPKEDRLQKLILESRYIDEERFAYKNMDYPRKLIRKKITPCVCEICKRYHELFHTTKSS